MPIGILTDDRYLDHVNPPQHPETRVRLVEIGKMLDIEGWRDKAVAVKPRAATPEEIGTVHSLDHYRRVEATKDARRLGYFDPDTFYSSGSFEAAVLAVGGLLECIDLVIEGELDNAFAFVRPPGHHAERDWAQGFCLFNNVAVAAAYLNRHHGLDRVMVIDWDVHHGNGTQHSFEDSKKVLFCSSHQYPFYPGTGNLNEKGKGEGEGYTINLALPYGQGDGDYIHLFEQIVRRAADAYKPQFVLISAGYDGFVRDPIGGMHITEHGFGELARIVRDIAADHCGGKLVATLEGGYDLTGIGLCVNQTLRAFSGATDFFPHKPGPEKDGEQIVEKLRKINKKLLA